MSFVKISTNIRVNGEQGMNIIRLKNATIINRIQKMTLRVLKRAAPVKTGKFRNSIRIVESSKRESSGIFQGFVKIKPTAPHSKFVIKKTRPSQGAYVPAIKKRIKFGQHPGTRANNFISASKPSIIQKAQAIVDSQYGAGRYNVRQFIR